MLGSAQVLDNLLQVRYSEIKGKSISVNVGGGVMMIYRVTHLGRDFNGDLKLFKYDN